MYTRPRGSTFVSRLTLAFISDFRVVNLGTRADEHEGCNWDVHIIKCCSFKLCVATLSESKLCSLIVLRGKHMHEVWKWNSTAAKKVARKYIQPLKTCSNIPMDRELPNGDQNEIFSKMEVSL